MTENQSKVTGFQTLSILAVEFETKDRQSRGVIIDQYRDPCAQGSHLETFRVSLPAYCPKIHSLPGGISKYLENQNREHGGCFTV